MFKAVTGRWNITVAENRQPYFTEWASSFGPYIKNIPIMFWMFFVGSALLFKKLFSKLNRKDVWIVTLGYVLFLSGMIFSRYAEHPSILDGDSFLSKSIYYLSALLLIGILFYEYRKYGKDKFEEWSYEYIFLFSLFILSLFSARTAVRLIMVLAPIAPIFASYLMVESVIIFRKNKEETMKIFTGIFMILVLIGGIFAFVSYYQSAKATAYYGFVPNYYNQQWQKGMDWVRTETSTNAVFAHWWDYGYWVQSIGDRATIVDGGNAIVYWNYLMGRLVLTGDNQQDSLDFLYSHNATHLLIDSSDIGKYSAFSSIGSDEKL
jgi:asparagine N-glycosylation enzyme membrane subunit Stt3